MSVSEVLNTVKFRQYPPNSTLVRNISCLASRVACTIGALAHRDQFESINYFCLFVGHPRSGHSLIGSLLDAHPRMIVAHEFDVLRHLTTVSDLIAEISERELYYMLLKRSEWFVQRNAKWSGYRYAVPSQHKGEYTSLEVIGDKKGGDTALMLAENPQLLTMLQDFLSVPIKVMHVSRHPFDNIATMAYKDHGDIDLSIESYFHRCEGVQNAREQTLDRHWFTLHLEDFIEDTEDYLDRICNFFGVKNYDRYLRDCSNIVFDKPNKSRSKVSFSKYQIERIREESENTSYLSRYQFYGPS